MDVAGALLPFTQVVRPELTIHVQEVLTQAERETETKLKIPEINEPDKNDDGVRISKSEVDLRFVLRSKIKNKLVEILTIGRNLPDYYGTPRPCHIAMEKLL
ncbi:unnamed protein product, partial [Brenthis ino]